MHLGTFAIEKEAAVAFDKAALMVRGSAAKVNTRAHCGQVGECGRGRAVSQYVQTGLGLESVTSGMTTPGFAHACTDRDQTMTRPL